MIMSSDMLSVGIPNIEANIMSNQDCIKYGFIKHYFDVYVIIDADQRSNYSRLQ